MVSWLFLIAKQIRSSRSLKLPAHPVRPWTIWKVRERSGCFLFICNNVAYSPSRATYDMSKSVCMVGSARYNNYVMHSNTFPVHSIPCSQLLVFTTAKGCTKQRNLISVMSRKLTGTLNWLKEKRNTLKYFKPLDDCAKSTVYCLQYLSQQR